MKKVLLIHPPEKLPNKSYVIKSKDRELSDLKSEAFALWMKIVTSRFGEKSIYKNIVPTDQISISFGMLSLYSYLRERDIDVEYIHCDYYIKHKKYSTDELIQLLITKSNSAYICGYYSVTTNFMNALYIAEKIKKMNPSIYSVIGGPHATFCDEEIIRNYPDIDFVVRGEGEETFYQIIKYINGEVDYNLEGTTYQEDSRIIQMPERPLLDCNNLPQVDFSILPQDYTFNLFTMYSRGCPFSCNFCAETGFWKNKVRFRDPYKVVEEIKIIKQMFNQKIIHIADSEIDSSPHNLEKLISLIESSNVDCKFSVNIRPDAYKRVSHELLRRLDQNGFNVFFIGVESSDDNLLSKMNRKSKYYDFIKTIDFINESGGEFIVIPYIMLGFPGENKRTMKKTIDNFITLLEEKRIDYMFPKIFIPYPGTDVYNNQSKYNIVVKKQWELFARYSYTTPFIDPRLSDKTKEVYLKRFYKKIINTLNTILKDEVQNGKI